MERPRDSSPDSRLPLWLTLSPTANEVSSEAAALQTTSGSLARAVAAAIVGAAATNASAAELAADPEQMSAALYS
jgi:hypothetical protein